VCLQGARFATLAVLPIVLTLELRGASFVGIWMGPAYAGPAGAVLTVLALPVWASAGFDVVTAAMIGINQHRGLIPVFVCEAFMNVLLSIALVPYLGIVGVAWGTALPRLIVSLFVGPLYVRRHARVPLRAYWTQTLLRPAVGMIPFALVTWVTEMWWPASNIWGFFGQVLTALPVAALGAWFVVLTPRERHTLAPRWVWILTSESSLLERKDRRAMVGIEEQRGNVRLMECRPDTVDPRGPETR
jgi:O-antigen/teichoic acid export membrane protein